MNVVLPMPGKYVVAVSGGVDSVALLHVLRSLEGVELVVAHFDHGIREESAEDRKLVQGLAEGYDLPFIYSEGKLGADSSEATAREARYKFLNKVLEEHKASAIITAHHQDDVLETAIINLMRGTGRKGLTSLGNRSGITRPLLKVDKADIQDYALANDLKWNEDSTNQDEAYLRNYIRQQILPKFDVGSKTKLLEIITSARETNQELDELLGRELKLRATEDMIDRRWFNSLPHAVALEVLASWLREQGVRNFESQTLQRLTVAAKTGSNNKRFPVIGDYSLLLSPDHLTLVKTP